MKRRIGPIDGGDHLLMRYGIAMATVEMPVEIVRPANRVAPKTLLPDRNLAMLGSRSIDRSTGAAETASVPARKSPLDESPPRGIIDVTRRQVVGSVFRTRPDFNYRSGWMGTRDMPAFMRPITLTLIGPTRAVLGERF
jgi:hypothetical protein